MGGVVGMMAITKRACRSRQRQAEDAATQATKPELPFTHSQAFLNGWLHTDFYPYPLSWVSVTLQNARPETCLFWCRRIKIVIMKILCCDELSVEIVGSEERTFACRPNKSEKVVFAGKAYEFVDFVMRNEIPVFNFRAC